MSQNFRLFLVSHASVRNFRIFLLMYLGSPTQTSATRYRAAGTVSGRVKNRYCFYYLGPVPVFVPLLAVLFSLTSEVTGCDA